MHRFSGTRAEEAYRTGFISGLPKHIGRRAHWIIHQLLAAHTWQDVRVIGRIARWSNYPHRYGLLLDGKWWVTFAWDDLIGAVELKVGRR